MAQLRRLSVILSFAFALALVPACAGDSTSTTGQLIECDVAADGTTSNCQPTDSTETDDPDKCVDVDEDGDDDPYDDDSAESDDDSSDDHALVSPSEGDDDGDGTPDEMDSDDDNDGVPDSDDCDEEQGGQDDEADDDDSADDDL